MAGEADEKTEQKKTYITVEDAIQISREEDLKAIVTQRQEFEEKIKKLEESFQRDKVHFIEVLGIFAALFTFISVNIQIFSKLKDLSSAIYFMLVMSGITITILLVIDLMIEKPFKQDFMRGLGWHKKLWEFLTSKFFILLLLAVAEIILGMFFTSNIRLK